MRGDCISFGESETDANDEGIDVCVHSRDCTSFHRFVYSSMKRAKTITEILGKQHCPVFTHKSSSLVDRLFAPCPVDISHPCKQKWKFCILHTCSPSDFDKATKHTHTHNGPTMMKNSVAICFGSATSLLVNNQNAFWKIYHCCCVRLLLVDWTLDEITEFEFGWQPFVFFSARCFSLSILNWIVRSVESTAIHTHAK